MDNPYLTSQERLSDDAAAGAAAGHAAAAADGAPRARMTEGDIDALLEAAQPAPPSDDDMLRQFDDNPLSFKSVRMTTRRKKLKTLVVLELERATKEYDEGRRPIAALRVALERAEKFDSQYPSTGFTPASGAAADIIQRMVNGLQLARAKVKAASGGKKSRKRRTKKSRTKGGKKSRKLRKRTTLKGGKRKRRRTRRRR